MFGVLALAAGWNLCAFSTAYADHPPLYRSRGFFLVAGVWCVLFGGGLVLVGFGILR